MTRPHMSGSWIVSVAASALVVTFATTASADEAAEKYVDDAAPYMYHSCRSVVAEAAGNEGYIDTVIRAQVAVSLYNREIDVSAVEISADRRSKLHDRFIAALRSGCERDKNALLAGVIDRAVAHAISDTPAEDFVP
ncbi:MAG: hypothetical protein AMXMBFR8_29520 [Nevskiales bacterium]